MDTRKIRKLIELVKETGIGELEVKSGEDSVRINCQATVPAAAAPMPPLTAAAAPQPTANTFNTAATTAAAAAAAPTHETVVHEDGYTMNSPMVGTVYLAPTPGAKPFVAVGDRVAPGDTLCMIEAMKMFNKIEADVAGVVSARLIENEQPVEYEQALFIIDTDE